MATSLIRIDGTVTADRRDTTPPGSARPVRAQGDAVVASACASVPIAMVSEAMMPLPAPVPIAMLSEHRCRERAACLVAAEHAVTGERRSPGC
jgi:hypothetical protein